MADFKVRYTPNDFRRALILALRDYSHKLTDIYKQKLIDNDVKATSDLINSAVPFSGELASDVYAAGIRLLDYWKYVENGRLPGTYPPPDAILNWIRARNIIPQPYQLPGGRSVTPTVQSLAFLISRKIATEGIKARPLLEESIDELQDELDSIVNDIVGEAITEITLDIGIVKV